MNRPIDQIKKELEEALAKAEALKGEIEAAKWDPPKGPYVLSHDGSCNYIHSDITRGAYAKHGRCFKTREAAEKANVVFTRFQRLYQLALELNDGWEPDWNDGTLKYTVEANYEYGSYYWIADRVGVNLSIIYFKNKATVEKAIQMIENGLLEL